MIKIKNYTLLEELPDPNQHPLLPKHPFRLLIVGPSGSGKTNLLFNFIYDYLKFDALYICAKNIYEPKYSKLREDYTQFEGIERKDILKLKNKKDKEEILKLFKKFKKETLFTSDLKDYIKLDDLNPSLKNLIIFDDCVTEKDQTDIAKLFMMGRHRNASIIYLSQSYYSTPKEIRINCDYFIFFNLQPREMQKIIREIDGSLTKEKFTHLYKKAVQEPYDFLMLDLTNPKMRYRDKTFHSI